MTTRLVVLIGGAPGVGKTTVLDHLPACLGNSECVDADRVWPPERPAPVDVAVGSVVSAVENHLNEGRQVVFVSWVFAREELFGPFFEIERARTKLLHLMASQEALESRSKAKFTRGLRPDYQRQKVELISALPTPKIDTTHRSTTG